MCRVEEARVVMEDCNHGQKLTVLDTTIMVRMETMLFNRKPNTTVTSQYWETDAAIQQYALTNLLN